MRCEEVREALPAYADGEPVSLALRRHLAGCAGCRAESELYASMSASLLDLSEAVVDPPEGLLAALESIPARQRRLDLVRHHVVRNRRAYAGGAAVAVAGALAAVWTRRRLAAA